MASVNPSTLSQARTAFENNPPEDFLSLNSRTRKERLANRAAIETRWQCNIGDCLPEPWRPHEKLAHGQFAKIGDDGPVLPWYLWSTNLLDELARLASTKGGELDVAQRLLACAITERHASTRVQKYIAELMPADVKSAITALEDQNNRRNAKRAARIARGVDPNKETDDEEEAKAHAVDIKAIERYMALGSKKDKDLLYSVLNEETQQQIQTDRRTLLRQIFKLENDAGRLKHDAADEQDPAAVGGMLGEAVAFDSQREELQASYDKKFGPGHWD